MDLDPVYQAIAERMQEAAKMPHSAIRSTLEGQLGQDMPGAYLADVAGDDESGDVVYHQDGKTYKTTYQMGGAGGKVSANIDHGNRAAAVPHTTYKPLIADDSEHYTGMSESERIEAKAYYQFSERFISKSERDSADDGDFAGAHRSFPILKPEDVSAAAHALGRGVAGGQSGSSIKAKIIAIAKRKGWTTQLPDAWKKGGDPKEAAVVEIVGDLVPLREGAVGQDGSAYLKIISPGWGSSGYYSADVLKRDGPKIFRQGTKNYWNHPTAAEEAARPEGSLRDLASVLTEDAKYLEGSAAPAGPGLYAKANVFDAYRQPVDNLAPHIGMSIRAEGKARQGTAEGRKGQLIEELTRGLSVDYVTSPGAGGKVLKLFEAARSLQIAPLIEGETSMEKAEVQAMIAEALREQRGEVARLREQVAVLTAPAAVNKLLESAELPPNAKARLANRIAQNVPLTEAGRIDDAKLKTLVDFEVSEALALLETAGPMRFGRQVPLTPTQATEAATQHTTDFKETLNDLAGIFAEGPKKIQEAFVTGRAN